MKKYYGFEFWGNESTTTGEPNPKTGCMSIAGTLAVFSKKLTRDGWVECGTKREAVTAEKMRHLCCGMSVADYNAIVECTINDKVTEA